MIEMPVHNQDGQQVATFQIDEQRLGGRVRPNLLKQAYVRFHANRRQGSAQTRGRGQAVGSTRKIFKQKGSGNARRGNIRTNILRGGGVAFGKKPHSWRQRMPIKMRRLANRNALLAKAIDGEIKLLDQFKFDKPSTGQFAQILSKLDINRTCLIAVEDTTNAAARSAANLANTDVIRIDQLNAFELLNHRYLIVEKAALEKWVDQACLSPRTKVDEAA